MAPARPSCRWIRRFPSPAPGPHSSSRFSGRRRWRDDTARRHRDLRLDRRAQGRRAQRRGADGVGRRVAAPYRGRTRRALAVLPADFPHRGHRRPGPIADRWPRARHRACGQPGVPRRERLRARLARAHPAAAPAGRWRQPGDSQDGPARRRRVDRRHCWRRPATPAGGWSRPTA